jgi:hypothetical protein
VNGTYAPMGSGAGGKTKPISFNLSSALLILILPGKFYIASLRFSSRSS